MKQIFALCCFAVAMVIITGCESTSETSTVAPVGLNANDPGVQDKIFIREALTGGLNEMELAKIAMQRASNLDLQLLARRIFDDHKRGNEDLEIIAHNEGIQIPQLPRDGAMVQRLAGLSGNEFDRTYLQHVIEHHRFDVKRFESTARSARNEDVRNFAGKVLPALQEHLRIAENISEIAGLEVEINEPTGAERKPFYEGDAQRKLPALEVTP